MRRYFRVYGQYSFTFAKARNLWKFLECYEPQNKIKVLNNKTPYKNYFQLI